MLADCTSAIARASHQRPAKNLVCIPAPSAGKKASCWKKETVKRRRSANEFLSPYVYEERDVLVDDCGHEEAASADPSSAPAAGQGPPASASFLANQEQGRRDRQVGNGAARRGPNQLELPELPEDFLLAEQEEKVDGGGIAVASAETADGFGIAGRHGDRAATTESRLLPQNAGFSDFFEYLQLDESDYEELHSDGEDGAAVESVNSTAGARRNPYHSGASLWGQPLAPASGASFQEVDQHLEVGLRGKCNIDTQTTDICAAGKDEENSLLHSATQMQKDGQQVYCNVRIDWVPSAKRAELGLDTGGCGSQNTGK
eukprot:g18447.t1